MSAEELLLVTGAAGKVGSTAIARLLAEPRFGAWRIRALCHKRPIAAGARVEVVTAVQGG